jgi:hypothetical protein
VVVPGTADLLFVLFDQGLRRPELPVVQSGILRQFSSWRWLTPPPFEQLLSR